SSFLRLSLKPTIVVLYPKLLCDVTRNHERVPGHHHHLPLRPYSQVKAVQQMLMGCYGNESRSATVERRLGGKGVEAPSWRITREMNRSAQTLCGFNQDFSVSAQKLLRCGREIVNFRNKEKQILDDIIGGRYDSRIRPQGNFTNGDVGKIQLFISIFYY
uniref:Uncharacterized protein n=1 Tax=Strigamia maritima TaxID=126957 RepID=T1IVW2_STRMM